MQEILENAKSSEVGPGKQITKKGPRDTKSCIFDLFSGGTETYLQTYFGVFFKYSSEIFHKLAGQALHNPSKETEMCWEQQ